MRRLTLAAVLFFCTVGASAQAGLTAQMQRAARAFNEVKARPLDLHAFLLRMPKGADLHMHLSGAVYAETFLADAVADHLCIDPVALALAAPTGSPALCPSGELPAAAILTNQKLYDDLIDSFSMRGFVPSPGVTGHDQFFATFARFGGIDKRHTGEWLDEVATRAEVQNEQYLEVMMTPPFANAAKLGYAAGWPPRDPAMVGLDQAGTTPEELAALRDKLLAGGLREEIAADREAIDGALADRRKIERCDAPRTGPVCDVQIRVLYQILRAFPPQQVFAQTLLGFELASVDPNVVGINFVQPEDARLAMSEYTRQMRMLDYLHGVYPKVHISLHAGELAPGLVPPEGLGFHIREAIAVGHAERIGHGVDVMYEKAPHDLLKFMADQHIMVEINLTSNDVILGVSQNRHALSAYRNAHVPVALSTDDEGVSRIDITHEYARAVLDHGLTYVDLKTMARTSLEHSFLPGASLWAQPDVFTRPVAACSAQPLGRRVPTAKCTAFLQSSERAAQQWELEQRYTQFEANLP